MVVYMPMSFTRILASHRPGSALLLCIVVMFWFNLILY